LAKNRNAKDIYGFNVSPYFNKTTFPFWEPRYSNIGAYIDSLAKHMAGLPRYDKKETKDIIVTHRRL